MRTCLVFCFLFCIIGFVCELLFFLAFCAFVFCLLDFLISFFFRFLFVVVAVWLLLLFCVCMCVCVCVYLCLCFLSEGFFFFFFFFFWSVACMHARCSDKLMSGNSKIWQRPALIKAPRSAGDNLPSLPSGQIRELVWCFTFITGPPLVADVHLNIQQREDQGHLLSTCLSQEPAVIRTRRERTDLRLAECYRRESAVTQGALTVISVGSEVFTHWVLDLIKDLKWFINKR